MGRMVKQVSEGVTKHYWYPGDKKDWVRAGVAIGAGAGTLFVIHLVTGSGLLAAVLGTSVTAAMAGLNFGKKDSEALAEFAKAGASKKAAVGHSGKAAWRALVKGFGAAFAAIIVMNMSPRGFWADWVLPLVPAVVGALAHQAGMLWERLAQHAKAEAERIKKESPIPVNPAVPGELHAGELRRQIAARRAQQAARAGNADDGNGAYASPKTISDTVGGRVGETQRPNGRSNGRAVRPVAQFSGPGLASS